MEQVNGLLQTTRRSLLEISIVYAEDTSLEFQGKAKTAADLLKEEMADDPDGFKEAEAAISTLVDRIKAVEFRKLSSRFTMDLSRHESSVLGIKKPKKKPPTKKDPENPTAGSSGTTAPKSRTYKTAVRRNGKPKSQGGNSGTNGGPRPKTHGVDAHDLASALEVVKMLRK